MKGLKICLSLNNFLSHRCYWQNKTADVIIEVLSIALDHCSGYLI